MLVTMRPVHSAGEEMQTHHHLGLERPLRRPSPRVKSLGATPWAKQGQTASCRWLVIGEGQDSRRGTRRERHFCPSRRRARGLAGSIGLAEMQISLGDLGAETRWPRGVKGYDEWWAAMAGSGQQCAQGCSIRHSQPCPGARQITRTLALEESITSDAARRLSQSCGFDRGRSAGQRNQQSTRH